MPIPLDTPGSSGPPAVKFAEVGSYVDVGIVKIDAHAEAALLQFMPNPPIDGMRIIELIQKNKHIRLNGPDKLRITAKMPDLTARVSQVKNTIRSLTMK